MSSSRLEPATLRSTFFGKRLFLALFFWLSSTLVQWLSGRIAQRPSGGHLFVAWSDPNQHPVPWINPNSRVSRLRLQHCTTSAGWLKLSLKQPQQTCLFSFLLFSVSEGWVRSECFISITVMAAALVFLRRLAFLHLFSGAWMTWMSTLLLLLLSPNPISSTSLKGQTLELTSISQMPSKRASEPVFLHTDHKNELTVLDESYLLSIGTLF